MSKWTIATALTVGLVFWYMWWNYHHIRRDYDILPQVVGGVVFSVLVALWTGLFIGWLA